MDTTIFVFPRHVRAPAHDLVWRECLACIRRHHPCVRVLIIDDYSDARVLGPEEDEDDPLTTVVRAEDVGYARGSGELLPYLYLLDHREDVRYDRAVVLNDSMFVQRPIDDLIASVRDVAFLWDFPTYREPDVERIIRDAPLEHADELVSMYQGEDWRGCFATASVITRDHLATLDRLYGISRLRTVVVDRPTRCSLERAFAMCCIHHADGKGRPRPVALLGDITRTLKPFFLTHRDYVDAIARGGKPPHDLAVVKVWNGR
jgi:hypothetical protein